MAQNRRAGRGNDASKMKTFYGIVAGVVVLGVGALAWVMISGSSPATEPVELNLPPNDLQALIAAAEGIEAGDPGASVRMIEFADYMCPGCAHFAMSVRPALSDYTENRGVRFTFFDFPLPGHVHSFLAARAARCAGDQDRFWDYHDILFARQQRWSTQTDVVDDFVDYAEELGLDRSAFASCLNSDRHAEAVTAGYQLGQQLGVTGTPTVIVNNQQVVNWQNPSAVTEVLDRALGGR